MMERTFSNISEFTECWLFDQNQKDFQHPTMSDFFLRVPTFEPIQSLKGEKMRFGREPRVLIVVPLVEDPERIFNQLIWQMIFGSYFQTIHWFILFNLLNRRKKSSNFTAGLWGLLLLSRARGPSKSWRQSHSNIRSVLRDFDPQVIDRIVANVEKALTITLPRRDRNKKSLLLIREEQQTVSRNSIQPPRFIGIGYKDKGSKNENSLGYDPTEISDLFFDLRLSFWSENSDRAKRLFPELINLLK